MARESVQPFFRANVGLCIVHPDGRTLAVERSDSPGSWQLPQGGIDPGETPEIAAWRELKEETGLTPSDVALSRQTPDWWVYELPLEWQRPKTGWGQAQKWFLFTVLPKRLEHIAIGPLPKGGENSALGWRDLGQMAISVPEFRRTIYHRLHAFIQEVS